VVFNVKHIKISGDKLQHYLHHSDESGRWIEQKFCSACGSNIGLTLEVVPGIQSVAAGTLDDPMLLNAENCVCRHVFTRSAQPWSVIPPGIEQFEKYFRD